MSKAIDYLISKGRDPLEILFEPMDPDIAAIVEQERLKKLDARLSEFIHTEMPDELRLRLAQLIDAKVKREVARLSNANHN